VRIALVGLPGSGKTSLFNAIAESPVELLPGIPGAPPHVSTLPVPDERLEWLRDLYRPAKWTPVALEVEDLAGIPAGEARSDRRGELFQQMRLAEGLVVVLRAFASDRYAYADPDPDPVRDLELVALEFVSADLEICERRLARLAEEWRKPQERERVERERAIVEHLAERLRQGRGLGGAELRPEEIALIRGFQLLTLKPTLAVVNRSEEDGSADLPACGLDLRGRLEACLALEADLAALEGEERELFAAEYGVAEPLKDRFAEACYGGLGRITFFTTDEKEVRAWSIEKGDDAITASGKIHSDFARGFIRAEVVAFDDLRALGSIKEVRAKGRQRLEGRDYIVADGDILRIRFSV
jgi:GTP-binding protein YchF